MRFLAAAALALLVACTTPAGNRRTIVLLLTDNPSLACGSLVPLRGCARMGDTCTIIAERPQNYDDRRRLETLGHELWHCFNTAEHD